MTHHRFGTHRVNRPLATVCGLLLLTPWLLAGPAAAAGSPSVYQREQARCMRITVHGERANCLSEASTAHAARGPSTPDLDPGRFTRNALERCKPLSEPDRSDCVARIQGQGTTSGSVAGGGIYRELVTREPAASAPQPAITPRP